MSEEVTKGPPDESIVDRLYRAALLLSDSNDQASALVRKTLVRSKELGAGNEDVPALFRLLLDLARSDSEAASERDDSAASRTLNNNRIETVLGEVRVIVARSFQELPADVQTVLYLSEVERMSTAQVASVVGKSEEDVRACQEIALNRFYDDIFTGTTGFRRERLIEDLPDSWISDALGSVMQSLGHAPADLLVGKEFSPPDGDRRDVPPISGPSVRRPSAGVASAAWSGLPFRSILTALLLILSIGFGAKIIYERLATTPDDNVITLIALAADRFTPDLETDSSDRLRRFLSTHFRDNIPMPLIEGMRLAGAGLEEIAPNVRIVGMRFVDADTQKPVTVYTFSYRFLEGQSTVALSSDVLRQIQSDADFDLHDLGKTQVLVWRHRANIYFAVTELDGRELRPRIYYPAAPESG